MQNKTGFKIVKQVVSRTFFTPATVLVFVMVASALKTPGQGTVWLNNRIPGILVTRVYEPQRTWDPYSPTFGNTANDTPAGTTIYTGSLLSGSGWTAQLWAAPGANRPESELVPANPTTTFRTGAGAGHVVTVLATMPNVPADAPVATVQMRVWPSTYPSWDAAYIAWTYSPCDSGVWLGKSPPINVTNIGGDVNSPPYLLGLQSFSLVCSLLDGYPPYILDHPQSRSVSPGETVSFTVRAASQGTTNYQWRFFGSNIVGATTHELQLTNVQASQAGVYSVEVHNAYVPCCSAFSSNAVLVVGNPGALSVAQFSSQQLVLDWQGVFYLQAATNLDSGFTDLPGPVIAGPYIDNAATGLRFFRLRR